MTAKETTALARTYKDRIADKIDVLDAPCEKCVELGKGNPHKSYPGFKRCWTHLRRAERALSKRSNQLKTAQRFGFYVKHVSDSIKHIRNLAEMHDQTHHLTQLDMTQELVLARLLVADWLEKHKEAEELPLKDLLQCLELVSKLGKLSQDIAKAERAGLTEETMKSIVTAISHAFHKANLLPTPDARAISFAEEIATIFSGSVRQQTDIIV